MAVKKLGRYKSPGISQGRVDVIPSGSTSRAAHSKIHIFINSFWNKEELPQH